MVNISTVSYSTVTVKLKNCLQKMLFYAINSQLLKIYGIVLNMRNIIMIFEVKVALCWIWCTIFMISHVDVS